MAGFEAYTGAKNEILYNVVKGYQAKTTPFIMNIFHDSDVDTVSGLSGTYKYMTSEDLMSHKTNDNPAFIALNAAPDLVDTKLRDHSWAIPGKFSVAHQISKADLVGGDVHGSVEIAVNQALAESSFQIDYYGSFFLKPGAINTEYVAGTAWSDPTSDPLTDIEAMQDVSFGVGDVIVLGANVERNLSKHPSFREQISNFAADGGRSPRGYVANYLSEVFDCEVFVARKSYYRNANKRAPILASQFKTIYDDICYVGSRDHLRFLENPEGSESLLQEYNPKSQTWDFITHRWVVGTRVPEKRMGVTATGI